MSRRPMRFRAKKELEFVVAVVYVALESGDSSWADDNMQDIEIWGEKLGETGDAWEQGLLVGAALEKHMKSHRKFREFKWKEHLLGA